MAGTPRFGTALVAVLTLAVAVTLTGCRDQPAPEPTSTPTSPASTTPSTPIPSESASPHEEEPDQELIEEFEQAIREVLGEHVDMVTGSEVADTLARHDLLTSEAEVVPPNCAVMNEPEVLPEESMALGTLINASDPGVRTIEQLGVFAFEDEDSAVEHLAWQRHFADECASVEAVTETGAMVQRTVSYEELNHHTSEAMAVHQHIIPSTDEPESSSPLAELETTTVYVREGARVYSYLNSDQADLGISLTKIDQLLEALSTPEASSTLDQTP